MIILPAIDRLTVWNNADSLPAAYTEESWKFHNALIAFTHAASTSAGSETFGGGRRD